MGLGKPSARTRCFRRVCKPALTSALAACALILLAGVSGILWQLRQTESAHAVAVQKSKDEEAQRKLAERAQQQAERSELILRQNLYAANLLGVQRALEQNDLGSARKLLAAHRPAAGQTDLRGFEWRYFWGQARGDSFATITNSPGQIVGSGNIYGNLRNRALVSPGASVGTLWIAGYFAQESTGTLKIELGGNSQAAFDQLLVSSNAFLAGTLQVRLIDGFNPDPGDEFLVLGYGSRSGTFTSITGTNIGNGLSLATQYRSNGLFLVVTGTPASNRPISHADSIAV